MFACFVHIKLLVTIGNVKWSYEASDECQCLEDWKIIGDLIDGKRKKEKRGLCWLSYNLETAVYFPCEKIKSCSFSVERHHIEKRIVN